MLSRVRVVFRMNVGSYNFRFNERKIYVCQHLNTLSFVYHNKKTFGAFYSRFWRSISYIIKKTETSLSKFLKILGYSYLTINLCQLHVCMSFKLWSLTVNEVFVLY